MTQHKLASLVLILTVLIVVSCRKTNFGTSLAMQNHLDEEIEVEVFPIVSPYSSMTKFKIPAGEQSSFYNTGVTDKSAVDLISATFDSIKIYFESNENIIVFTPDTAINYNANPYIDLELWQSRTIEYQECSMICEDKEDLNHYFEIEPNMVSKEN